MSDNSNSDNHNSSDHEEPLIPKEVQAFIESLPPTKREEAKRALTLVVKRSSTSTFRGPVPPPSLLKEYDQVIPDGAERILKMAENQSEHRIALEKLAISEQLSQSRRGQHYGFILGLVGLILASILAIMGHDTVAGIFGTTTIIGLVTVFVIGRKKQREEDEK